MSPSSVQQRLRSSRPGLATSASARRGRAGSDRNKQVEVLDPIDPAAVAAAQAELPLESVWTLIVETFESLADPTRARMLYALSRRPMCVRDLALLAGVSQSAASHQLRFLRERRIVKPRREGNVIYYVVDDHHVAELFREAEFHADHVGRGLIDHPYR